MSIETATRVIRGASSVSLAATALSCAVLAGTAAAMPDPVSVGKAAVDLAGALPTDVTRLALSVAMASILVNLVLVAAMIGLVQRAASKPCLLFREDGLAVLGHSVERGVEKVRKRD